MKVKKRKDSNREENAKRFRKNLKIRNKRFEVEPEKLAAIEEDAKIVKEKRTVREKKSINASERGGQ